jgi:hypothetical protein
MTKITVTIDIDKADESIDEWANEHIDTYRSGVLHVDKKGVYHMYYKQRTNIIDFEEIK